MNKNPYSVKKLTIKELTKRIGQQFPAAIVARMKLATDLIKNKVSTDQMDQAIRKGMLEKLRKVKITQEEPNEKGFFAYYCKDKHAMASCLVLANHDNVILGDNLSNKIKNINQLLMETTVENLQKASEELVILRGLSKNNIKITNMQVVHGLKTCYFYAFEKVAIAIDMVRETKENLTLAQALVMMIEEHNLKSLEEIKNMEYNGNKISKTLRGKIKKIVVMDITGGWSDNVK